MAAEKSRMVDENKISGPNVDIEQEAGSLQDLSYATKDWHYSHKWTRTLLQWGLETRGALVYSGPTETSLTSLPFDRYNARIREGAG